MGGTLHRYPFGDDIDCSALKFGFTNRTREVGNMPPQPPAGDFNAPVPIGAGSDGHLSSNGAIGADSAGQSWFVSGSLGPNWNTVQFTRAHHPVNLANPGWLTSTMTEYSRRPPSLASRPPADSVHLWGAAWTPNQQTLARDTNGNVIGNGIQIVGSTNEFQTTSSAWWLGPNTWNVPQEPTLFYDINTQRFGLLFIRSDNFYNDEAFAVTSPDLVNWTSPQDLAFQALDAPYASCVPFSWCTMTWTMAYLLDPKAATKSFTINPSTGAIQWGSSRSSSFSDVPRGVGITASRVAGNPTTPNWLAVITLPDPAWGSSGRSMGAFEIYWSQDPGNPPGLALNPFPSHTGWPYLTSDHRANIVSDPWNVDWTYVITTETYVN